MHIEVLPPVTPKWAAAGLDPARWTAHWARPRCQPGYALLAETAEGPRGWALLAHERYRLGAAILQVAGVTLHAPDPAVRSALVQAATSAAAEAGLAWMQLEGLPAHYAAYGLAPCRYRTRLQVAPHTTHPGPLQPATPAAIADLTALHTAWAPRLPLSIERTADDWRWLIQHAAGQVGVIEDPRGQIVGYGVRSADGAISEAGAADAGVGKKLLAALAATWGAELHLGPEHPLARVALSAGGTLHIQRGSPQVNLPLWGVIDLVGALTDLRPTLLARLAASHYRGWTGKVGLETATGGATLVFGPNTLKLQANSNKPVDLALRRVELGALAQLLLGYRAVADLRATGELRCADTDLGLLDSLFPLTAIG